VKFFLDYGLRPDLSPDPSNLRIVLAAITIAFYSEVGVADAYFNAEKSAKICGICGKLKFRPGLSSNPSSLRIV
jgi:hypothetical protein